MMQEKSRYKATYLTRQDAQGFWCVVGKKTGTVYLRCRSQFEARERARERAEWGQYEARCQIVNNWESELIAAGWSHQDMTALTDPLWAETCLEYGELCSRWGSPEA